LALGERFAGDPERALRLYAEAEERWPIMGQNRLVCETPRAALLCDAGRYEEALTLISNVPRAQTGPWMRRAPLLCCVLILRPSTAARALAHTGGSREEALRLGREAVALADQTDQPMLRVDSRIDLADVLDAFGERSECARVVAEALAIYAQKGLTPPTKRLRDLGIDAAKPGASQEA
jgi:hypothetical protein